MPADQRVRFAAVRLGWAYLGSPGQPARGIRRYWIVSAIIAAVGIWNAKEGVPQTCLVLVGAWAIGSFEVLGRRRIQLS